MGLLTKWDAFGQDLSQADLSYKPTTQRIHKHLLPFLRKDFYSGILYIITKDQRSFRLTIEN